MSSLDKRISGLRGRFGKNAPRGDRPKPKGPRGSRPAWVWEGEEIDFARLLQEKRLQKEKPPETPISERMLEDPELGGFWGLMLAARKRVAGRCDQSS